jgi:hypothetical protein
MTTPTREAAQVAAAQAPPSSAARGDEDGRAFGERYFLHLIGPPSLALAAASAAAVAVPGIRPHLSYFCHQIVERTFCPHGTPMGLCARCTGIYIAIAGAWAGLGWLKRHPAALRALEPASYAGAMLSLLLLAAGIDVSNWPRFGLGLSFGLAAAFALWRTRQFVLWRRRGGAEATA